MRVKCEMFIEDIEVIQRMLPQFKKWFYSFDVISKSYVPDTATTEWDGEPGDLFEVEFEVLSMNHFLTMAKRIGVEQYKREHNV